MIRQYIKHLVKKEVARELSEFRKDMAAIQANVNTMLLEAQESAKLVHADKRWIELRAEDIEELHELTEKACTKLTQDTIIKLESYEEAAQAMLCRKS